MKVNGKEISKSAAKGYAARGDASFRKLRARNRAAERKLDKQLKQGHTLQPGPVEHAPLFDMPTQVLVPPAIKTKRKPVVKKIASTELTLNDMIEREAAVSAVHDQPKPKEATVTTQALAPLSERVKAAFTADRTAFTRSQATALALGVLLFEAKEAGHGELSKYVEEVILPGLNASPEDAVRIQNRCNYCLRTFKATLPDEKRSGKTLAEKKAELFAEVERKQQAKVIAANEEIDSEVKRTVDRPFFDPKRVAAARKEEEVAARAWAEQRKKEIAAKLAAQKRSADQAAAKREAKNRLLEDVDKITSKLKNIVNASFSENEPMFDFWEEEVKAEVSVLVQKAVAVRPAFSMTSPAETKSAAAATA